MATHKFVPMDLRSSITYAEEDQKDSVQLVTRQEQALEQTTYDGLLFASCYLEDDSCENNRWAWLQFGFAALLQCLAVSIQFLMTLLLFVTVVLKKEKPYENNLGDMLADVRNATQNHEILDKDSRALNMCLDDQTLVGTHAVVLFLWVSRMVHEIGEGLHDIRVYYRMGGNYWKNNQTEVIEETRVYGSGKETGRLLKEKYAIVNLTPRLRWFFIIALGVVRAAMAAFLTYTSGKFLMLSGSVATVVLKAVSMQFIVTFDEFLFKIFMPATFKKQVKEARLVYPGERPTMREQWTGSVFYIFVAIGSVWVLAKGLFPKLSAFREACRSYFVMFPEERDMVMDPIAAVMHAFFEDLKVTIHQG